MCALVRNDTVFLGAYRRAAGGVGPYGFGCRGGHWPPGKRAVREACPYKTHVILGGASKMRSRRPLASSIVRRSFGLVETQRPFAFVSHSALRRVTQFLFLRMEVYEVAGGW